MTGTFTGRMEHLRDMIGTRYGSLTGYVTVDQVYAHYQHERLDLHHPRGGQALYLSTPLLLSYQDYLRNYANALLRDGGQRAMKDAVEDLSDQVEIYAPVEFADLRRSGHPQIRLGWRTIYDRPPKQHRLSPAELKIKARLRKLPPEIIGFIWWHVMHNQKPPPHLAGRRKP